MELIAEVTSKQAFVAAIRAAAHPTYEQARANPVQLKWNTTTYTFKEGIHEARAEELLRNVNRNKSYGYA